MANPRRIHRGRLPETVAGPRESDFCSVEHGKAERIAAMTLHRGTVGVKTLHRLLREALDPGQPAFEGGSWSFRVGDEVTQLHDNHETDVPNGDIPRITRIDAELQDLKVRCEERQVRCDFSETYELTLPCAVSLHTSQGCGFPAVVLPVHTGHHLVLQRNLLYTAVTRSRRLAVLVGTKKAPASAVRNDKTRRRYSGLSAGLREAELRQHPQRQPRG